MAEHGAEAIRNPSVPGLEQRFCRGRPNTEESARLAERQKCARDLGLASKNTLHLGPCHFLPLLAHRVAVAPSHFLTFAPSHLLQGLLTDRLISIRSAQPMSQSSPPLSPENRSALLNELVSLGPEAQGNIDDSILLENLASTPAQRLIEASRAATQIEVLREAMRARERG